MKFYGSTKIINTSKDINIILSQITLNWPWRIVDAALQQKRSFEIIVKSNMFEYLAIPLNQLT